MAAPIALNELSVLIAEGHSAACRLMSQFVKTVKAVIEAGAERAVLAQSSLYTLELCAGYPLSAWVNDHSVDTDERRYFRLLTVRYPYLAEADAGTRDEAQVTDVVLDGDIGHGLLAAYLLDGLAVSFDSAVRFQTEQLNVSVSQLDDLGHVISRETLIPHASSIVHVDHHRSWIEGRASLAADTAAQLWNFRATLFPGLEFDSASQTWILALNGKQFRAVKKAFGLMQTNLSHPSLRCHKFDGLAGPNGEEIWEAYAENNTPAAYRIFYYISGSSGKPVISAVTKHLRM